MLPGKKNLVYFLIFSMSQTLKAALDLWETYWLEIKDCVPDNISHTLKRIPFNDFNNIKSSLRILGSFLVTTCTCEQQFLAMRQLKTYTKSTMVSERLNGIALMHVHQEIVSDNEKVIDFLLKTEDLFLPRALSIEILA